MSFAPAAADVEFNLALGGGPALSQVYRNATSTSSGTGSMLIGGRFTNGIHLNLLIESAQVVPLEGAPSGRVMPKDYAADFDLVGMRAGYRWRRLHLWADAAMGSLSETVNAELNRYRNSSGHTMFGVGLGVEFAKWDVFSMELYAAAKQINRHDSAEYSEITGRNIILQNYGLAFNFYPAARTEGVRSSSYDRTTHFYCFDCGFQLMRVLIEVGVEVAPKIGAAITQAAFRGLMH
jgi:hypothetical protein